MTIKGEIKSQRTCEIIGFLVQITPIPPNGRKIGDSDCGDDGNRRFSHQSYAQDQTVGPLGSSVIACRLPVSQTWRMTVTIITIVTQAPWRYRQGS